MLDDALLADHMRKLLDQEAALLARLETLLAEETDALRGDDFAQLERVGAERHGCVGSLMSIESERRSACRLLGLRELGPGLAPMTAFLMLTGLETLPLRMRKHSQNAERVAAFLAAHPAVESVSYPLPGHPNHNLARRYCPDGAGSIFVATLKGGEAAAKKALAKVKLFSHLVNIGETRSLIAHPASTTHRQVLKSDRDLLGITQASLRFSIGIEDAEDLLADLEQALA